MIVSFMPYSLFSYLTTSTWLDLNNNQNNNNNNHNHNNNNNDGNNNINNDNDKNNNDNNNHDNNTDIRDCDLGFMFRNDALYDDDEGDFLDHGHGDDQDVLDEPPLEPRFLKKFATFMMYRVLGG